MKDHTRRVVAYIAGRLITGRLKTSIYDYAFSRYYSFSGNIEVGSISVFDYSKSCHITGNLPSLYHYGNAKHLSLKIDRDRFTGYDYDESVHFSGSISSNSISFYDYGKSAYFNFSI